jgi:hypothetical protein
LTNNSHCCIFHNTISSTSETPTSTRCSLTFVLYGLAIKNYLKTLPKKYSWTLQTGTFQTAFELLYYYILNYYLLFTICLLSHYYKGTKLWREKAFLNHFHSTKHCTKQTTFCLFWHRQDFLIPAVGNSITVVFNSLIPISFKKLK